MNHMDAEGVSNDETAIISELLNSAEALQSSANLNQIQLQRKDEPISLQNNNNNKNNIITLPLTECNNVKLPTEDTGNGEVIHNVQCGDIGDVSKLQHIRHVHIPYILNGELYQIQTQDGENVTVKCCHCPPDRVYRGSVRSTGNFHMHIKRRHPDLLEKLHDMKVNALLERRDRLMRNRKMIHRSNRNRPAAIVDRTVSADCIFKSENKANVMSTTTDSQNQLDSTSELSSMHTHKLKIKTVFQRHQMQQREAELRNWNNNGPYANMPIEKLTNDASDQPINYSLKSQESNETNTPMPSSQQHKQHMQSQEQNILPTCGNTLTNLNKQTTILKNSSTGKTELTCESHTNTRNLSISTSSISISCPSVMSSFSSNNQYDLDIQQQCSDIPEKHGRLAIVKPEHLLGTDSKAINLSIHTDSGIFSNSDDDDGIIRQNNDTQNNDNNNKTSNSRAGSRLANSATNTDGDCNDGCNNSNKRNTCNSSLKWQELLMQVENSLRDIQREMNVRNQIESNRMFLDIAKFKFLHPGFQFNF